MLISNRLCNTKVFYLMEFLLFQYSVDLNFSLGLNPMGNLERGKKPLRPPHLCSELGLCAAPPQITIFLNL